MVLALVTPTPFESKEMRCEIHPAPGNDMKKIFDGELDGRSIIFTHCGVGKVNAAHSVTLILENYNVEVLILFGIAGAYPDSGLKIGDIAIAQSENYGEEGVLTRDGWRSMEFPGFPLLNNEKEYYNTFMLDYGMEHMAADASKDCGFNVRSGNFVTVSQCSGTRESGEVMKKRFDALCENMEGAAAAHICTLYEVPMVEMRGISNIIEDRDMKKWDIRTAAANCNKAVIELVRRLK